MEQDEVRGTAVVAQASETDDLFAGETIVARDVSYQDYLTGRYGRHTEWINGVVIAMSPISVPHDQMQYYLRTLLSVYLQRTAGGFVFSDPVVMKSAPDMPGRQPDIQVVLPDRAHFIEQNQVAGPANLVVEIVSPDSVKRDRGAKFDEYEKGGVTEYWIIDPERREALFYVVGEDGLYHSRQPVEGVYSSHVLSKLRLHVETLWQEKLPEVIEIVQMVEQMLMEQKP
ncbi:MAG: restriction endonuclease [Chloroflexota bacterium]|nr:MAG: restriction endonuclease [Chloroflexota bacterium]